MKIGDMDYEQVKQLFRALRAREVEYVVVGAVAIGLHGLVRGTQDVDLFIRPDEENVAVARVATPRMLIRMKRGTLRPLDARDLYVLEQAFPQEQE